MELKAEIARKNTELKKLLNGEEISDLRNKARIIYRRNAELEKENDKLKALVSNLKTKVIPELRNKLINKSDEKKIILKNKPINTLGTFLNNDQLSKIDLRKTSVVTKKTKRKNKKLRNKKS